MTFTLLYVFIQLRTIQRMLMSVAIAAKSAEALKLTLPPALPPVTMSPSSLLPQVNVSLITLLWFVLFCGICYYCCNRHRKSCFNFSRPVSHPQKGIVECEPLYPSLHEMIEITSPPNPSAPDHSSQSSSNFSPLNIIIKN